MMLPNHRQGAKISSACTLAAVVVCIGTILGASPSL
jgi:hypothetical protein